ncbi:MAG: DUF3536 domain-containing protein, partial [Deltaproteobacteria bacterium]|nr:DUF3536 domain-containing protein [Deltaproteobacteria bacterium]
MAKRYLCIHGHFYQPPRENPWLDTIEPQDSAAPFNDWNARISSECYGPNGVSRIRGQDGHIIRVANNYSQISFNFGPTLLSWMARHDPEALAHIVEGDRQSCQRLAGHGNAIAQAYNHMIMPLASPRDRRTQIVWGLADFRHRFGREPEAMWLPETAVNTDTLEALAEFGLRYAILSPRQARRWRPPGGTWCDAAQGDIDPRRAYRLDLPSGRSLALFFYDGGLAHGVAFGGLLDNGDNYVSALLAAFGEEVAGEPLLVQVATDGESYGHHHRFGDMALAYALNKISQSGTVEIVNYGYFLAQHPPTWEAEIWDNSSWSCAHGVERWRSNCGCNLGRPGFHQRWRKPLREAMDLLKARLDAVFEEAGGRVFKEPWAARDDYVRLLLDRGGEAREAFFGRHLRSRARDAVESGLRLLEMQRNGMLMFTSCGWFFDELSGIEGVQILKYAQRALQLAEPLAPELEAEFLGVLDRAESNLPQFGDGRGIWQQLIRPARVDLDRVVAHHAVQLAFDTRPADGRLYAYQVTPLVSAVEEQGDNHLAVGRALIVSDATLDQCEASYAVLHFGGLDLHVWVRRDLPLPQLEELQREALRLFHDASIGDVYQLLLQRLGNQTFKIQDLFALEQRQLIARTLGARVATYRTVLAGLVTPDLPLVERLWKLGHAVAPVVKLAAQVFLEQEIDESLDQADDAAVARIEDLVRHGYRVDEHHRGAIVRSIEQKLLDAIESCRDSAADVGLNRALRLLAVAHNLELPANL